MKYFWSTFKREWRRLCADPHYAFCFFLAPIISIAFFLSLMMHGLPTDLPLGIVDQDRTEATRMLKRHLDSFQQTRVKARYSTVTDARKAMQRREIYGFFYIPKGTTSDIYAQRPVTVSFYTNFTYIVAGSLLSRDMRMMAELASGAASRQILRAKGWGEDEILAYLQPIIIDSHPIGNPWLNYNVYISNVILPGILGIFIFMITVYSIGVEIKERTSRKWLAGAGHNIGAALLGKLIPHTMLFFLMGFILDVIFYKVLLFPCHDGLLSMLVVMFLFIIGSQGLGVLMITLLPSLRLGLSAASLWGVVSFSISGMSYPVMAMDAPLQGFALLFPLRHYFLLYVNSALDGYALTNCMSSVLILVVFACIPLLCGRSLKKSLLTLKYVP